jgi:hypothetical protein
VIPLQVPRSCIYVVENSRVGGLTVELPASS